jgi:hypothetical protein
MEGLKSKAAAVADRCTDKRSKLIAEAAAGVASAGAA